MSSSTRRKFSKEFKIEVVEKKMNNTYTTKQIYEEYQIDRQTLSRWVKEYKKEGEAAFDPHADSISHQLKKYEEKIERLERELEILKKAEAYFAQKKQTK